MKKNLRKRQIVASDMPVKPVKLGIVTQHAGINRCLSLIEKRFCEPIRVKHLVHSSKMSSRGFHNAFVRNVGVNPGKFLRTVRIEHAKRLLIWNDLNVEEIANRSGFQSNNTFWVAFLREVKTSPKKFQREYWMAARRRLRRTE